MANTQPQFLLMFVCIMATPTTKGAFEEAVISGPLNRVVYEGATNTEFTCLSNDTGSAMEWVILPFANRGDSNQIRLTTNGELIPPFSESFAIDLSQSQSSGAYTLVALNATISLPERATFSTAGAYCCTQQQNIFCTQLVVVRTDPTCSSNFTQLTAMPQSGDTEQLSCTIVYGSYRSPLDAGRKRLDAVMTWFMNGQPIPAGSANFTINPTSTEVTASSILLIRENFDATYECRTTFNAPVVISPVVANNTPDYFKTCTISRSDLPATGSPTATTTSPPSTATTKTSPAPVPTTTGLPPCTPNILELLLNLILGGAKC